MQLKAFERQGMNEAKAEWEGQRRGNPNRLSFDEYVKSLKELILSVVSGKPARL